MLVKKKLNKNESLVYLKKINKFLVLSQENLNIIEAYLSKSKADFKHFLITNYPSNKKNLYNEIQSLFKKDRKEKILEKSEFKKPEKIFFFNFKIKNKSYSIEFNNRKIISSIIGQLKHLEENSNKNSEKIIVYSYKDYSVLKLNGKMTKYRHTESHVLTGKVISHIISKFHDIKYSNWTGFLHGTTIAKNHNAALIVGNSGSGKTISSTILVKNSFDLICDDISPLSQEGKIGFYPNALSIKKSGFKKIDQILDDGFYDFRTVGPKGPTRYLYPKENNIHKDLVPCDLIIKINYDCKFKISVSKLHQKDILPHFLEDSFINKKNNSAESFMSWVLNCRCYNINYSKDNDLIGAVENLLNA